MPGQRWQSVENCVPVLCLGLDRVEDGAVAVHQGHRGGEVEDAAGDDQPPAGEVVRLAHHQPVDVEVESVGVEDEEAVQAAGGGHGEEDSRQADLER